MPCMKLFQVHPWQRRTYWMFLYWRCLIIWRTTGCCFLHIHIKFFWRIPPSFRFWFCLTLWFTARVSTKFRSRPISVWFNQVILASLFPKISGSLPQTTLKVWKTCNNQTEISVSSSAGSVLTFPTQNHMHVCSCTIQWVFYQQQIFIELSNRLTFIVCASLLACDPLYHASRVEWLAVP